MSFSRAYLTASIEWLSLSGNSSRKPPLPSGISSYPQNSRFAFGQVTGSMTISARFWSQVMPCSTDPVPFFTAVIFSPLARSSSLLRGSADSAYIVPFSGFSALIASASGSYFMP